MEVTLGLVIAYMLYTDGIIFWDEANTLVIYDYTEIRSQRTEWTPYNQIHFADNPSEWQLNSSFTALWL